MFEARIARGKSLLKERGKSLDIIDADRLSMVDFEYCILGQMYENFHDGILELGLSLDTVTWGMALGGTAAECGFTLYTSDVDGNPYAFETLTDEWKEALRGSDDDTAAETPGV